MKMTFNHFNFNVQDMERSLAFYTSAASGSNHSIVKSPIASGSNHSLVKSDASTGGTVKDIETINTNATRIATARYLFIEPLRYIILFLLAILFVSFPPTVCSYIFECITHPLNLPQFPFFLFTAFPHRPNESSQILIVKRVQIMKWSLLTMTFNCSAIPTWKPNTSST